MKFPGIFSILLRSVSSADLPYLSTPYLLVSCAIRMISSIPLLIMCSASFTISGIVLDCSFPLSLGIMQKVHLLSHHSAILRYSNLYAALVYACTFCFGNLKSGNVLLEYQAMRLAMVMFSKSDRERKKMSDDFSR